MYIYFVAVLSLCGDCCMCCDRYNHWVHEDISAVILFVFIFINSSVHSIYQSAVHWVLHISISVLDLYLYSVCQCVVMVTTVLVILLHVWLVHRHLLCLSICMCLLYYIFRIPLCINVKVWNNSLLWQPNMCTTIKNSGWNWHNVVNAWGRQVEVFECILVVKNTNHWKRKILPVAACRSLCGPQAMTLFHVI